MEEVLPKNGMKNKAHKRSEKKDNSQQQPLSKRQELNNHIVHMRQCVKQARVQIINRLKKQVERWRKRKGSSKEQEKALRKADRLVEEILTLKKIKKDKVSLFALQDTRELQSVLSDPQSSTEERVLSRLSHHNVITAAVQKYRNANPNWDRQIPVLLEMTRAKRRKKKGDNPEAEEGERKEHKTERVPRTSESEPDSDHDDEETPTLNNDTHSSESEEEEAASDSEQIQKTAVVKKVPVKRKAVNGGPASERKSDITKQSSATLQNKSEGTVKVKFLTDLNDLEEEEEQKKQPLVDVTKPPPVKKPKSAFFVGGVDEPDDKPEPSYRPEQQSQFKKNKEPFNRQNQNGNYKPVFKKGKLVSKPPPSNRNHQQRGEGGFGRGRPDNRFGGNSEPLLTKGRGFAPPRAAPESASTNTAPEKLHPSWEAKKKQQQISLTQFTGKKIVFNDDD